MTGRVRHQWLGVAVALAASSCGMKRVPGNILEKLPYEAKIELLEAENDLALAVDRLDEARNEVTRTRDQIRRAKERLYAAKSEVGNATDDTSREVAELAVVEAEKRVEWLRASQRINGREEELAEQNLVCAQARYEQSRLAASRKAKLEGSEKLDPEAFERQVTRCEEDYAELKEELKETSTEAEQVRAAWDEARAALAKKTFDARASPFVE
jgi:chromosome segregation ATPase